MIKHLGNVADLPRPLRRAERKIVILGQIEFAAKPDVQREGASVRAQVPDIHEAAEQLGTPFRFEKWIVPFSLRAQSIFVAVKDVRSRRARNRARQLVE